MVHITEEKAEEIQKNIIKTLKEKNTRQNLWKNWTITPYEAENNIKESLEQTHPELFL